MATKHPLDSTKPSSNVGGRPPTLKPEHIAVLHDIVTERAQASLQEIANEVHRRCGLRVCDSTIRRALRPQGIVRLGAAKRDVLVRRTLDRRAAYLNVRARQLLLGHTQA